jgi:hypothetical protein
MQFLPTQSTRSSALRASVCHYRSGNSQIRPEAAFGSAQGGMNYRHSPNQRHSARCTNPNYVRDAPYGPRPVDAFRSFNAGSRWGKGSARGESCFRSQFNLGSKRRFPNGKSAYRPRSGRSSRRLGGRAKRKGLVKRK